MMKWRAGIIVPACTVLLTCVVGEAEATQVHAGFEALVAHQMAHVFFVASMGTLIYWLRRWKLVEQPGWRLVQYSALFFTLWNVDAVIVHYLDGRDDIFRTINAGTWHGTIQLSQDAGLWGLLYYFGKMDHLLSLPAIILLYAGLRQLLKDAEKASALGQKGS